jgi:LysR family transcriptional regulator, transcriptional activator of nhaA
MDWLNYHHLLYFWTVVREGGVSRAAEKLRLSQPTVSAQVRRLEDALGHRLFERRGRTLVPTAVGRVVYQYAEDIFGLGGEMLEALRGRPAGRALQLTVGVANAVPKLIVSRLLQPVLRARRDVKLVCVEGNPEELLTRLATHALDVVISDTPAPPHVRVRVFNHALGESGTSFFAPAGLVRRSRFPQSLNGPMLLPTATTAYRRALDEWFDATGVRPKVVAEFDDSALLLAFAGSAQAMFPAPTAIERDVCRLSGARVIGRTDAVRERYVAVSVERKLKHPAVVAITRGQSLRRWSATTAARGAV